MRGSPVKHPVEQILRHCRFDSKGRVVREILFWKCDRVRQPSHIPAAWQAGRLRWPHQGRPATADGRLCSTSQSSPYQWCGYRGRTRLKTSRGSRDAVLSRRKPTSRKRVYLKFINPLFALLKKFLNPRHCHPPPRHEGVPAGRRRSPAHSGRLSRNTRMHDPLLPAQDNPVERF